MVLTGMTIASTQALWTAAGGGFFQGLGSGVLIQSGINYAQGFGPTQNVRASCRAASCLGCQAWRRVRHAVCGVVCVTDLHSP
jgi:hypothetical protein